MQKEYLFGPSLLKDWTITPDIWMVMCPILCFKFSAFFPSFSEVQTFIKREAGQDISHGILTKFWENKVLKFTHFTSFISSLWKKDLNPELLNNLFKEVIKNS